MGETISIVNENDEIICYKDSSEVKQWDIKRISSLRIENSKWEVLIAKRSNTMKKRPWKRWAATTWCADKWESYEDTMKREAKEELWIEVENYREIGKVRYKSTFIQNFKAIMDIDIKELKLQKEEVETVKWIKKD